MTLRTTAHLSVCIDRVPTVIATNTWQLVIVVSLRIYTISGDALPKCYRTYKNIGDRKAGKTPKMYSDQALPFS